MKSIRSISDLRETFPVNRVDFGFDYSHTYEKSIDTKLLGKEIELIFKEAIRYEFRKHLWSDEIKELEVNEKYRKPEVIVLRSPLACQLGSLILVDLAAYIDRHEYLNFAIKDYIHQHGERNIAWDRVEKLILQNWELEFISKIRNIVSFKIWKEVWKNMKELIRNYILTNASHFKSHRSYNVEDFKMGQNLSKEVKNKFASQGIFEIILLEHFCLASELPSKILRNQHKELHSEKTAALEWRDGYGLYFWNGINVPKEWIIYSEALTKETILAERNIERRRCLIEILGNERFFKLMDFACIDSIIDDSGNPMKLFRTRLLDSTIDDFLFYLNVIDPSTKREYFIAVPPCYDVHWAKSASFQDRKIQYRHGDVGLLNLDFPFDNPLVES